MERRTFLKLLGGLGTRRWSPRPFPLSPCRAAAGSPPLSRGLLSQRNQNRSTVVAQHGMVCTAVPLAEHGGHRRPQGRRQRHRRRDRGQRHAQPRRADELRTRRRPLRHHLERETPEALRPQRQRPLALRLDLQQALDLGLKEIPVYSPLSWSVPGCVSGWEALHKRFGKLPFARLLEPVIEQARARLSALADCRGRVGLRQ